MKALTAISIAIGVLTSSLSYAATPNQFPIDKDARIADLGLAPQGEVRTITLSLGVKNMAAMEAHAASIVNPASPNYQKFLTPAQVGALYGQDATTIAQVVNFLQAQGMKITKIYDNNLLITAEGTNAQLAAVFGSPIHTYQAFGDVYEAPVSAATVPAQLASVVTEVHGLSSRPLMRTNVARQPMLSAASGASQLVPSALPTANAAAATAPGQYTTRDLASRYNINPLYAAGITGAGKTIGIASLAGYNQSDAYGYWDQLGLGVSHSRITDVLVDNGPLPKDAAGSDGATETTLDIEQSGGVAPGANIRMYLAPNSGNGFLDMMATAVNENQVDTLSVSWGSAEIASSASRLSSFHTVFVQAALQGIPVIAAAGDSGAYDINRSYQYPGCSNLMSVDFPAADPMVLAAGGTTLPISLAGGTIKVPSERAWGWDYLRDFVVKNYGQAVYYAQFFPVGGGGGVSVDFDEPSYQQGLNGVAYSAGAQTMYCKASSIGYPGNTVYFMAALPANYAGRNLPDVSLNADPYSGYVVYLNGAWSSGNGGTSFVAPQLNGIFTLIAAGKHSRLGQLHPQLYGAFKDYGYNANSPFRAVTAGTNLYYQSSARFNQATGLGTLDVTNLARAMGVQL